ncbi:MAG: type IV pilus modification protein PilV [Betaproteobacteria bacterium]|nr:MAG: type IV pilus modification protein PilV [Betaproteobacteria bacterium]
MKTRLHSRESGFTLIDILISLFILGFGMLALARVMAQSSLSEVEASQRSQAMTLAQDMAERINLNRKNAAAYVGNYSATWGPGGGADCSGLSGVEKDACEWQNLLAGGTTLDVRSAIGAPIAALGCVVNPVPNIYVIAVAWQGMVPTTGSDSVCGANAFDREENRRVFSTVVQIATLGK